ncbi:MAG: 23S rRNA (uracil(1939)-C(5))-methyltransferase RlmD [Clostridia bacterium]|nr:23S rRNA (uracil(1939)-C(5))-methyltransferase RlmD [Clostridia bacterium]
MDLIVGDIIQGTVSDFGSDGEGVIKLDGFPIFVPYTIKGEEVRARITFVKKACAFGEVVEILSPSPDRVKPLCPYFEKCGGCDLQHISTPLQREIKRDTVRVALRKFANLDTNVPLPVRLNDWEYRNKIALPFAYNGRSKRVSLGFYEKRSHKVVPLKWCPLHGDWASKLIEVVMVWANEYGVSVYDEATHKGLLRHIVARMLDTLSVTIVINGSRLPKAAELIEGLKAKFDGVTVYISENTRPNNVIMGDEVRLIYGRENKQNLGAFKAVVSPKSFLQVNSKVRDAIYDMAADALSGFDGDIIELYSGVGLLTAQIALRLPNSKITAVEIERSSHDDAVALMKSLGLNDRVKNVCDDAAHFLSSLPKENAQSKESAINKSKLDESIINSPYYLGGMFDNDRVHHALILDPPRRGCDESVLRAASFERIVYISCNPQSLARDLKTLSDSYDVISVTPFDMFPQTANVETLVCLSNKKTD